jgi:hypothetical protein
MPERTRPLRIVLALSLSTAALAAPVLSVQSAAAAPTATAPTTETVTNGTFDKNLDHWGTNQSYMQMYRSSSAKQGSHSVRLKTTKDGADVVLNDMPNAVASTVKGTTYDVSAWVRTADPKLSGQVRVREVHPGGTVDTHTESFNLANKDWKKVDFTFETTATGDSLDLSVLGWSLKKGQRLYIDGVSMRKVGAAVPATPPPPVDQPPSGGLKLSNGVSLSARGIPASGALVGAAVGGNADPAPFEAQTGQRLGVRRTYYGATGTDKAVKTARSDLANGRLPWISFKLPYSWEQMAAGKGDAWAKDIAVKMAALPGPVWIAFHHEPETDGDVRQWRAMQERLGPIVRNNAPNVAFTIILTGWHQISGEKEFALDALWPSTKVDVAGFDIYNFYKTTNSDGTYFTKPSDLRHKYFEPISKFVASKGAAWGLAETGYNDAAAQDLPNLMKETYDAMVDNHGVAFAYFNSPLNSSTSWVITTPAKLKQFSNLVKGSPMYPKLVQG